MIRKYENHYFIFFSEWLPSEPEVGRPVFLHGAAQDAATVIRELIFFSRKRIQICLARANYT